MDPLTALAAIKKGVTAGKRLHNLSKEIAGFFCLSGTAEDTP